MERIVYDRMAEQDAVHWWYVARRRILAGLIARAVRLPADARVLEVGCGTGHNLAMLGAFGAVEAVEIDPAARAVAERRLGRPVGTAPLPALDGVPEGRFDLVASLDVVEHVDDDVAALRGLARRLRPGGRLLVTVPAYPWMWSAHDEVNHHKRRYTKGSLLAAARAAGLEAEVATYFNTLLFPLAAAARIAGKIAGRTDSDDQIPPAPLNRLFGGIFALERHLVGRVPLPAGVSIAAILKPAA